MGTGFLQDGGVIGNRISEDTIRIGATSQCGEVSQLLMPIVLITLKGVSPHGGSDARPLLRRDAEHNRQRILDVARAMISDRGLNISHDQIASEAGLGVGTVYRRFPTLGELFDELFHGQIDLIVQTAEAALEIEDPWEGICEFMRRYFEQQAADRGLREYLLGHRGGTELARRARQRVLPVVTKLVARAHAAGRLHPDIDASDFALIPLLINPVVAASNDATPDLWRRWLAVVLEGITTGPRREKFPGHAPEPTQVDQIIGKKTPPRAGRS